MQAPITPPPQITTRMVAPLKNDPGKACPRATTRWVSTGFPKRSCAKQQDRAGAVSRSPVTPNRHRPPTGRANARPVTRLQRAMQYAAASRFYHRRLWNTGSRAFAGDDNWRVDEERKILETDQTLCPSGKSARAGVVACPAPFEKILLFSRTPNQIYMIRHPVRQRGVWPSSRTLGRDALDAAAPARMVIAGRVSVSDSRGAQTNGAAADGEVVWS